MHFLHPFPSPLPLLPTSVAAQDKLSCWPSQSLSLLPPHLLSVTARLVGGFWLVLALFPLKCLLAFCFCSWCKLCLTLILVCDPHSSLSPSFPNLSSLCVCVCMCVLTACSKSLHCCIPFLLFFF